MLCCPICNGKEGYRVGSDLPCRDCENAWRKALQDGDIPKGTSIHAWGDAIKAGNKALLKGKALQTAQKAARQALGAYEAASDALVRSIQESHARKTSYDATARSLFK